MKKSKKLFDIKLLIGSNPNVDASIVAETRAAIRSLRKNGFGNKGYDLVDRGTRSPLKQQDCLEKIPLSR